MYGEMLEGRKGPDVHAGFDSAQMMLSGSVSFSIFVFFSSLCSGALFHHSWYPILSILGMDVFCCFFPFNNKLKLLDMVPDILPCEKTQIMASWGKEKTQPLESATVLRTLANICVIIWLLEHLCIEELCVSAFLCKVKLLLMVTSIKTLQCKDSAGS